jgi:dTDP-4-dehydrorhamnose 3,5-epimerase
MVFREASLPGSWLIEPEGRADTRGFFARVFCKREFEKRGLATCFVQVNNSLNVERGTLRGMHYQLAPHAEAKLVRCVHGALHDVVLDLRSGSSTFGRSFGVELNAENRLMLYVPKGLAHGFITLRENTEVLYFVDEFYSPEYERGIRWDDPHFGLQWPFEPTVLSDKDRSHPYFTPAYHLPAVSEGASCGS